MAPLLCWTVTAYRKPEMSEEEYHKYMSEIHGPLVMGLMAKYGMIRFSMVTSYSYEARCGALINIKVSQHICYSR